MSTELENSTWGSLGLFQSFPRVESSEPVVMNFVVLCRPFQVGGSVLRSSDDWQNNMHLYLLNFKFSVIENSFQPPLLGGSLANS